MDLIAKPQRGGYEWGFPVNILVVYISETLAGLYNPASVICKTFWGYLCINMAAVFRK